MGAVITVFIAIALLSFIVDADTLQTAFSMVSSKYDVGKIGKKSISQTDFAKRVEYYERIFSLTNNETNTEESNEIINNSAWQSLLADNVLIPVCKNAGLRVGAGEMIAMAKNGQDLSPVLLNEPIFLNENGEFDQNKFQEFIQNIDLDDSGNFAAYWAFLERNMEQNRMFSKYSSMLEKGTFANDLQIRREIADNNNSYDVDFVLQPVAFAQDSTIVVSDSEIKQRYETIKSTLRQIESRDAELIVFNITPSDKDIAAAKEDHEKLYQEFLEVSDSDMKTFIAHNSDLPLNDLYFKKGDLREISSILDDFASEKSIGAFMAPQHMDNVFVAAKIMDIASRPDSVFVKYIPTANANMADSLLNVLKSGADFTAIASQYVPAQGSFEPGTIGWITEPVAYRQLPAGFLKAFSSKKGDMFTISNNGSVIIVKVDNTTAPVRKAKVAILSKEASVSHETFSRIFAQASKVVDKSDAYIKNFEAYAHENNLDLIPATRIAGGAKTIAGYDNMKEVSRWLFEAEVGDVSSVMTIDNKYFVVAALQRIHPDGYAEISEIAPQIKDMLTMQKKVDKLAAETKEKVGNVSTIEEVAEKLALTVSNSPDVTFSSLGSTQQLDPLFIGSVAQAGAANNNNVVGPVKGDLGVYYFQIKDKKIGAFYTDSDAKMKASNSIYSILNSLSQIICDKEKVVDQRYKFY